MERKEILKQIKELNLQEECKNRYGKNYTNCKTIELKHLIDTENSKRVTRNIKDAELKTEAKIEEVKIEETKTEESGSSFNKLLTILKKRRILLESDIKYILEN